MSDDTDADHMTTQEAAERLGVTTDTISSYIGRGLLSATDDPADRRRKLICAASVRALVAQRAPREVQP